MIVLHAVPVLMSVRWKLSAKEISTKLTPNYAQTAALALMYVPLKQSALNRVGKQELEKKAASKGRPFFYNFEEEWI